MAQIQRKFNFANGSRADVEQVDEEFDSLVNAHNVNDTTLQSHMGKGVDIASSDTTKDKHVSNYDLKRLQDQISLNVNNFVDGGNFTDVYTSQFAVLDGGEF